ncbi:hypothetical protein CEY08_18740 [Achromobacter insolitus]|nr:hypothetical protein CEY08_18740 [Achromobacter insolitus]
MHFKALANRLRCRRREGHSACGFKLFVKAMTYSLSSFGRQGANDCGGQTLQVEQLSLLFVDDVDYVAGHAVLLCQKKVVVTDWTGLQGGQGGAKVTAKRVGTERPAEFLWERFGKGGEG